MRALRTITWFNSGGQRYNATILFCLIQTLLGFVFRSMTMTQAMPLMNRTHNNAKCYDKILNNKKG